MAKVVRRETRKRGFLGKIVKWVFILFNLLMLLLMLKTCSAVGDVAQSASSSADSSAAAAMTAGAGLGGAMVGSAVMVVWALGTVILGALTYFTRGPSVVVEETVDD